MILTKGQEEGLRIARKTASSYLGRPAVGVIGGYAGCGKTTLLKIIAEQLGSIVVVTPTGKSALRVSELTGLEAKTIHRWIYKPVSMPDGSVEFTQKDLNEIQRPTSNLVVLDEASMVSKELWNDIVHVCDGLGCNILCVGDIFQLPPVVGNADTFSILSPNFDYDYRVHLSEVVRQALDSPIIRFSMKIRQGDIFDALLEIPRVYENNVKDKVFEVSNSKNGVVLCHRNKSRHLFNNLIREQKGFSKGTLEKEEPLLVLKNNYHVEKYNGEVCKFGGWTYECKPLTVRDNYTNESNKISFGRGDVDGEQVLMSKEEIQGDIEKLNFKLFEKTSKRLLGNMFSYLSCNYGYVLTVHKSQGSEFDDVLVVVENSMDVTNIEGKKWLYTAVTRAKNSVKIIWKPKILEELYANNRTKP